MHTCKSQTINNNNIVWKKRSKTIEGEENACTLPGLGLYIAFNLICLQLVILWLQPCEDDTKFMTGLDFKDLLWTLLLGCYDVHFAIYKGARSVWWLRKEIPASLYLAAFSSSSWDIPPGVPKPLEIYNLPSIFWHYFRVSNQLDMPRKPSKKGNLLPGGILIRRPKRLNWGQLLSEFPPISKGVVRSRLLGHKC